MLGVFSTVFVFVFVFVFVPFFVIVFVFVNGHIICLIVYTDVMLQRASKLINEDFLLGSFLLSLSLYLSLCVSLSLYLSLMLLTHCQDHTLTDIIWFVWSRTSYSGDKWRCYRCGTYGRTYGRTREDRATQPMDAGWLSFAILQLARIGKALHHHLPEF